MTTIEIKAQIAESYGKFFHGLSRLPINKIVDDVLSEEKVREQIELFGREIGFDIPSMRGKSILEVGSGFGVFLAVTRNEYGMESYGIEPSAVGFDGSFDLALEVLRTYGVPSSILHDAYGESLPFEDDSFDFVFSSNVLEHVSDPTTVLSEAIRVLKPGGYLQFVFPNYHSIFDGHYAVFHPPIVLGPSFLPWWVKNIFKRDPKFAYTIRTELNARSVARMLRVLSSKHSFKVLGLGERVFNERMSTMNIQTYAGLTKVRSLVAIARAFRLHHIIARCLSYLKMWTPIIVTIQKKEC